MELSMWSLQPFLPFSDVSGTEHSEDSTFVVGSMIKLNGQSIFSFLCYALFSLKIMVL